MDSVRMGVIGCGGMARGHMRYFSEIEGLDFVAAADVSEHSLKLVKDQHGVETYPDAHEMIQSGKVDAVLIGTPHYFHTEYAIAGFEAGLHVLSEKPVAVTAKDAQRMNHAYEAARAKNSSLVFAVMFNQRCNPLWKGVKRLMDQGRVGSLLRASWTITTWFRAQSYYDSGSWRATWKGEGGGVLLNQCPHNLDLFQWFVGMPDRVIATVGLGKHHDIEVEDEVSALLTFPDGATGTFLTSTAEAPGVNRLEIVGDRATLIAEPAADAPLTLLENDTSSGEFSRTFTGGFGSPTVTTSRITPGGKNPGHRGITENFIRAIREGEPLVAPGVEGIHSLELSNAMLTSGLRDGQPVDIPMDRDQYENTLQDLIENAAAKS